VPPSKMNLSPMNQGEVGRHEVTGIGIQKLMQQ
jgi:hypothetical protein